MKSLKLKFIAAALATLAMIIATDAIANKTRNVIVPLKAEMQTSWTEYKAIKMNTDVRVVEGFNDLELGKYTL